MSKQKDVRLIIRELSEMEEYKDLSYTDILNAVYWAQFGFVHNMISSCNKLDESSYHSIRLPYWGSFIAHPKRVNIVVESHKAKLKDKENEECSESISPEA